MTFDSWNEEEDEESLDKSITGTRAVEVETEGRIDKVLAQLLPDLSRARIQGLLVSGHIRRDGAPVTDASAKARPGQIIEIDIPPPIAAWPEPENIRLDIVHEDKDLLVLNKPAGLVVHPGPGNPSHTLVNALLYHCKDSLSGIGGVMRPGIVHRLDKETSGLMVVAKHDQAHQYLSTQLADRTLSRIYHALCWGMPKPLTGRIETLIGRHPKDRQRMAVRRLGGKEAITDYRVLKENQGISLVECQLQTGRTHQIRVHMAHIKYPIVGDLVYGRKSTSRPSGMDQENWRAALAFPRQALHAREISFIHPANKKEMSFEIDYPPDILELTQLLGLT